MAEGETEKEYDTRRAIEVLRERFQQLTTTLKDSSEPPLEASLHFCQEFCQVLVEHAARWKTDEAPLPLLGVYTVAILSYAKASSCLSCQCENVPLVLEKLALSCVELLLSLPEHIPGALWEEFQSSVKLAHGLLQETGNTQLHMLSAVAQQHGVWTNPTLSCILSNEKPDIDRVHEFLQLEGPTLLNMRIKHLIKENRAEKAAILAKVCSENPAYEGKGNFKQTYLVCLCMSGPQEQLMEVIAQVDSKDALEMICNLESEGDEEGALCLCSAFLKRQLLQGDVYCAWELTLFWSKLRMRLESSADAFLDQCKSMALLSRSVCHILFLIKVIQSEVQEVGLPVCIEMCVQALKMASSDNTDSKSTICKTISCLLPTDLEMKRACQLTEFLLQPTVDSYYAVESLYNEPDQKLEEENLPVPNSLRCELLLALKTQWPFDPEFWDWRTLKRNCLALMGEEAAIVSSIDDLNDTDVGEGEAAEKGPEFKDLEDFLLNTTNELNEISDEREKNREAKKLREKGFVSARFRNWRAYMQYCVLCDKEFLGHRIVRHAQKHFKDGIYTCPICADSFDNKEVFEPHVTSHVKKSCKERLAAMKATRKLSKPPQSPGRQSNSIKDTTVVKVEAQANVSPAKATTSPCGNHTSPATVQLSSPPKPGQARCDTEFTEDCVCPVTNCQKVFKFFRNLVAHVKAHKNDEEATRFLEIQRQKVVCQYCRRQFVNVTHLNDHLQIHCGTKPYNCIQLNCTGSFNSNSELLMHRRQHAEFKARCMFPNCGRIFNEAYLLYDHEAQHYLTFTCKIANCGRIFYSQAQLRLHLENHDASEVPVTSENHLNPTQVEPLAQCVPRPAEACSAFVRLERINAQAYMKDVMILSGSSTPRKPEVPKEAFPVKVKHSVESMLNCIVDPTEEQQTCYTPLIQPTLELGDGNLSPDAPHTPHHNMVANGENPLYPFTANPLEGNLKEEPASGLAHIYQKVLPQILPTPEVMIKSEKPFLLQPCRNTPGSSADEHCCPFEDCTRSYSTSKSLSRHVKKTHTNFFEEWKLAKKYKKVVKITSRKDRATVGLSQAPNDPASHHLSPLCNNTGIQPLEYPTAYSSPPASCYPLSTDPSPITTPLMNASAYPPWGNTAGLMQSEMSQPWSSSAANNCYADPYQQNEYPSRSLTHWQPEPYQTAPGPPSDGREKDHALAVIHGGAIPHVSSESSLMSQYVSSSLMLDNGVQMHNGGQPYAMMQPEFNANVVDDQLMRKGSSGMIAQLSNGDNMAAVGIMPVGSYQAPYAPNVTPSHNAAPRPPMDVPSKAMSHDGQIAPSRSAVGIIKTENIAHMISPGYENQMDSSRDGMLSPQSAVPTDFSYEDESFPAESEAVPSEEKSVDETKKGKRSSKRTKWPAIIKDGKVICRRCFREFSSTKSLGGHLSKRSQCKPIEEIDLTADLPMSFLDFLNDPHVPDTNGAAMFNVQNGEFPQEDGSLSTIKPSDLTQSEAQKPVKSHSSNNSSSVLTGAQPINNNNNNNNNPQSNGSQSENMRPNTASTDAVGPDDHLMEIQKAFQRLDLVEAAQERMLQEMCPPSATNDPSPSDATSTNDQAITQPMPAVKIKVKKEEQPREKGPKPFKCEKENCEYGFMTKEALFRHLWKMHDYTQEMIEELKKTPVKFSPYPCHICPKTFTRTTGLRIHYEKVHRLAKAEMIKLKIGVRKRRSSNTAAESEGNSSRENVSSVENVSPVENVPLVENVSSVVSTSIKQEPLDDYAIGCQMGAMDQEGHSYASEVITAGNAVLEGSTHHVTVERVHPQPQPPQNNVVNSDGSPDGLASPSKLGGANEEQPIATAPKDGHTPVWKQQLDQGDVAAEQDAGLGSASVSQSTDDAAVSSVQAVMKPSPEKANSSKHMKLKEEFPGLKKESPQKRLGLKMGDGDNAFSPYRPYRCVHEGCVAAFTIQQNLILHYRAMHQSSLPPSAEIPDAEKAGAFSGQEGEVHDKEVRCQVKDCSRIFPEITSLVQHYLLLHKFTRDKTTAMMSSMYVGTFQCDRPECTLACASVEKYIEHIKNYHKEINISERGSVDQTFKCESDGCDRVYTTRHNLLRHMMKKHDFVGDCKTLQQQSRTSEGSPTNGKENIENKLKMKKKNAKKKDVRSVNHWTSFGKPILKSQDEASTMCTKKSSLQYPCMIKGCDSVERAERNIFRHYTTHGLSERYIEDQRSLFIFCKKYSRSRFKDANKSEGMSTESSSEEMDQDDSDTESSKVNSCQEPELEPELESLDDVIEAEAKVSNEDESSESQASTVGEVRKKGRPRKSEQTVAPRPSQERKSTLRNRSTVKVNCVTENSELVTAAPQEEQSESTVDLDSFQPIGFEGSLLEFLESSHPPKRKINDGSGPELPSKRQRTLQAKTANIMFDNELIPLVDFRNPLNLKSVKNVKIVIDKTFSNGADLLLKQLQDMRPMVIIERWLYS